MSPGKTKAQVLRELRKTRNDMMSALWIESIRIKPIEVRREAALRLVDIKDAIHELQNAELGEIRDKLVAHEAELLNGTNRLAKARENLNRVKDVLNAAGAVLETLTKVAKFVATGL